MACTLDAWAIAGDGGAELEDDYQEPFTPVPSPKANATFGFGFTRCNACSPECVDAVGTLEENVPVKVGPLPC